MDNTEKLLKESMSYLQQRLEHVNDKADIFIAIQTGLFVVITWLFSEFFVPFNQKLAILILKLGYLATNFAFIIVIVALLLQTIRPSNGYFSLKTDVTPINTKGIMWSGGEVPDKQEFRKKIESVTQEEINKELMGTVYVLHQLVNRTYRTYRWSILIMKIQIIVIPLGFVGLVILQAVA